jgi:hypothetical protein
VPRGRTLDLASVAQGESPCPDLAPPRLWSSLAWYERLAVWLLAERELGAESAVSGYISYLPQPGCASFYDAPLHWGEDELRELQYPPMIGAVYEQREQIKDLHARLRQGGGTRAAAVSLEQVTWAEQVVWSRAFASTLAKAQPGAPPSAPKYFMGQDRRELGEKKVLFEAEWLGKLKELLPGDLGDISIGGGGAEQAPMAMALMPMLDSLNHASAASVACTYDEETDSFVLATSRPLAEGEQAMLTYGDKGNDELLQLFGFVEGPNPHDRFIAIGLPEQLRAACANLFANNMVEVDRRFALVSQLKLDEAIGYAELSERVVPAPTLHAARILLGTADELNGDLVKLRKPASLATEQRVLTALRDYCKAARQAMGSSRKADIAALGRSESSRRLRLALQFRGEKKRLLSTLENSLQTSATRSKKAGRPLRLAPPVMPPP